MSHTTCYVVPAELAARVRQEITAIRDRCVGDMVDGLLTRYEGDLSRAQVDHYLGYAPQHHENVEPVCTTCHHAREEARRAAA